MFCSMDKVPAHLRVMLYGAMKTEHRFGSLTRLLCPDNNTNFIADLKQIIEISRSSGDSPATIQRLLCNITEPCLCDWRLLT